MEMLYLATDLALGRSAAIKLLACHLVSDESAKVRFLREARAASALDHPNIATIHDVGEHDVSVGDGCDRIAWNFSSASTEYSVRERRS